MMNTSDVEWNGTTSATMSTAIRRPPPVITARHCVKLGLIERNQNGAYANSSLGAMIVPLEVMFGAVICLGVVGNLLVILAVVRDARLKHLRNFFIVNLAASDLLLCLITAPVTLYLTLNLFWPFGNTACQAVATLQALNTFVSSLTLAAIAFDRYLVILFPTRCQNQYISVLVVLVVVWVLSIGLATPYFFAVSTTPAFFRPWNSTNIYPYLTKCELDMPQLCVEESWKRLPFTQKHYTLATFALQYCTPLFSLIIVYFHIGHKMSGRLKTGAASQIRSKERRRTAQLRNRKSMLLLTGLVSVFAACWLPANSYTTLTVLGALRFSQATYIYCNLIGTTVAVFNPIMYGLLNENFRTAFKDMLAPADVFVRKCMQTLGLCSGGETRRSINDTCNISVNSTAAGVSCKQRTSLLPGRNREWIAPEGGGGRQQETTALHTPAGRAVVVSYSSLRQSSTPLDGQLVSDVALPPQYEDIFTPAAKEAVDIRTLCDDQGAAARTTAGSRADDGLDATANRSAVNAVVVAKDNHGHDLMVNCETTVLQPQSSGWVPDECEGDYYL